MIFTDPKEFITKKYKRSKGQVSLDVLLNELDTNPEYRKSIEDKMHQQNEERRVKLSYASSCVSQETRSKAGKLGSVQGTKNLEKARTSEHQRKAAKAAHKKNLETGYYSSPKAKRAQKAGGKASKDKFSKLRSGKLQIIFNIMEVDVKYTASGLGKLVNEAKTKGILQCPEASDFLIRECKGRGATATYKKLAK